MKHRLVVFGKFAAAALVTFACFEIYFRTTEISLPSFVRDDPVLGRAFRPNARSALIQEGFYMDRINEYGYLGPGYPPEKPEGTLRVALVGDSFVEAFQVFPKWNLRTVLESELSRVTGRRVEVLNFGLSGSKLRTMYAYHKDLVTRFHPDLTLFVIVAESFYGRDYAMGPKTYLDEDGNLKVNYDFARTRTFERKTRLRFTRELGSFQMLQSAWGRHRQGLTPRILFGKFWLRRGGKKELPEGRAEDRYFDLNKAVLEELGRIDESGRARVIIVGHMDVPAYYVPVIESAGLTYIDLKPELDELERAGADPYLWPITRTKGHWNHEGQRFIGEYLAKRLLEVGIEQKAGGE